MLKQGKRVLVSVTPFFVSVKQDAYQSATDAEVQKRLEAFEAAAPASGWERVKYVLFHEDEYGDTSPQAENIRFFALSSAFAGAIYGGYKKSQTAYIDFVRTNQATAFESHNEAKKRLQDRVAVKFFKGAAQLGWRTGLFGFMFMAVTNVVALYRNKEGIVEYSLGGLAAGMTYRTHLGLRGIIVGGILGGTLGTIGGCVSYGLLCLTGLSMTDVRNAQYAFAKQRQSMWQRSGDLAVREEMSALSDTPEVYEKMEKDENVGRVTDELEEIATRVTVKAVAAAAPGHTESKKQ